MKQDILVIMDEYTVINGKKYRKGYTTGSCAAAAAKAAALMLFSGSEADSIEIDTPAGVRLKLDVYDQVIEKGSASCSVVKDGGDDPDATNGLRIFARVDISSTPGISVDGGIGVGRVTLPGLRVAVGKAAINPVPMQMIVKEVKEVLPADKNVNVVISVPGGEETALRTFNPRLGILGGISILGTTGIVQPMSEEAWKESLALELSVLSAKGLKSVVLAPGNFGEDYAINVLGIKEENIVKTSNFMGYMLDKCVEYRFEDVLLVGHIGKLVKVAAGIFHTHSAVADARAEIMAAYAGAKGASRDVVNDILSSITTDAAMEIIDRNCLDAIYLEIASRVTRRSRERMNGKANVGTVLFGTGNRLLAMDGNAHSLLSRIQSI